MAPGRKFGGAGGPSRGKGQQQRPQQNRRPNNNNNSNNNSKNSSSSTVKSLANVFSTEDDFMSKSERRRRNQLDEVENYEYNVDEIEDEDDEEIDSDDAFDDVDEEKFENFQFYGSKDRSGSKKKKQPAAAAAAGAKGKGKKQDSDDEDMMDQDESADDDEEEDEEEEDEDGADYMDLSEMLNQPEEEEEVKLPKKVKLAGFNDFDSEDEGFSFGSKADKDSDESEEDDEEEEEGEEEEEESMDEDEDMDDKADKSSLTSFIDSLETTSKKRKNESSVESTKKSRKNLRERTEAYEESEYNLQAHRSTAAYAAANGTSAKKKLDLLDLVSSVQEETGFGSLKKNVQALEGLSRGKAVDTLAAPLPKIVQDRLNREAAYDTTKKQVSKWLPIIQENRKSEHLAFPMNQPVPETVTNMSMAGKFAASTEMEREVDEVLKAGGMKEKELVEFEELALNKVSVEEVEKRRTELRMMRELMFRDEIRAKRVAKIKSKMYRKIKKKERERNALTGEEMKDLDPEQALEEQLLEERKRAEERMTLKHKNTGKWAKDQLKHGNFDPDSRQAITEQIERGDRLRRKIQDVDSDEELSGGESEYSDMDDDDVEGVKARAFDELAQVEEQLARAEDAAKEAKVGKGVFAMKFMQDAAKRNKLQAQVAAEDFRREMEEDEAMMDQPSDDEWRSVEKVTKKKKGKKSNEPEAGTVIGPGGRMVFGNANAAPVDLHGKSDGQEMNVKMNKAGQIQKVALSAGHTTKVSGPVNIKIAGVSRAKATGGSDDEQANPWMQTDGHGHGKIASKKDKGMTKDSSKADKLKAKLKKRGADVGSDDDVAIDTSSFLTLSKDDQMERGLHKGDEPKADSGADMEETTTAPVKLGKAARKKLAASRVSVPLKEGAEVEDHSDNSGDDSEDEEAPEKAPVMVHTKAAASLSQRDIIARAFANDNVVSEFEKEKRDIIEADKPKDVDMTLPGW
ncbi:hypothetical protein BGW38_006215, partial [Lunasporangiospora selenospora]